MTIDLNENEQDEKFLFYGSFYTSLVRFKWTPLFEEAADALFQYWCYWKKPDENINIAVAVFMDQVIPLIDAAKERYNKLKSLRSEAGKKWWAPEWNQNARKYWEIDTKQAKTSKNKQKQAKTSKTSIDIDIDNDIDNDIDKAIDTDIDTDVDKKEKIYKKENLESTDLQQTTDIETEDKPVSNKEEREKDAAEKEKEYYVDWDNVIIDWGVDRVDFFIEYVKRICDKLKIKFADYNARKFCKDFLESEEVANRCKEKQIWIPWLLYFTIAVPHKIPSLEQYQPHSFFDIYYKYRTIYEIACWNLQDNKDLYKLRNKSNSREQKFVKEFVYHLKPEDMNKNIQISFNE